MATDTEKIIVQIVVKGARQLDDVDKKTKQTTKSVGGLNKSFAKLAARITAAVVAFRQISKVVGAAVKTFKNFEFEMAKVRAITNATEKDFQKLESTALQLGRTTFFTASQVAELQVNFGKLGFSTQEILQAQEATLLLATATQSDLGRAAIVAGATVRGFGLTADETARVVDVMGLAFTSSALDIEKFQTSMTKVSPIAASSNITLESTTAVMGTLTDAGIEASIAGTSLRNIFLKLADPTSDLAKHLGFTVNSSDDLEKALKQLNAEGLSNSEMMELVDLRQVAAFATMVNGTDRIIEMTDELDRANGSIAKMAELMGDTLQGDILEAKSAFEGFQQSIVEFTGFDKFARRVTQAFTFVTNAITDSMKDVDALTVDMFQKQIEIAKTQQAELKNELGEETTLSEQIQFRINELERENQVTAFRAKRIGITKKEQARLTQEFLITNKVIKDLREELDKLIEAEKKQAELDKINADIQKKQKDRKIADDIAEQKLKNKKIADAKIAQDKEDFAASKALLKIALTEELNAEKENLEQGIITKEEFDQRKVEAEIGNLKQLKDLYQVYGQDISGLDSKILDLKIANQKRLANITKALNEENKKQEENDFKTTVELFEKVLQQDLNAEKDRLEKGIINQEEFNDIEFEAELAHLNNLRDLYIAYGKDITDIDTQILNTKLANNKKESDDDKQKRKEQASFALQIGQQAADTLFQISQQNAERQFNMEVKALDAKLEAGIISQERYDKELDKLNEAEFYREQRANIGKATMEMAINIIKAIGDPLKMALAAGVGLSQIAVISSQRYALGGMVEGKSHANGGEKFAVGGRVVELEGGEAVINKRSTSMFRSQLSAMNAAGGGVKFADGGLLNMPSFATNQFNAVGMNGLAGAVSQGGRVYVLESDITNTQNNVSLIQSQAGF